jgi:hypothetical protein
MLEQELDGVDHAPVLVLAGDPASSSHVDELNRVVSDPAFEIAILDPVALLPHTWGVTDFG